MSMLTNTYYIPTQPPEEDQVAICSGQANIPYICGLMSDLVICKDRKEYGHI